MDDPFFLDREFDAEIDLTPLIDVVFMLLVFFFMASTFIKPVMEINLPAAASARAAAEQGDEIVLTITAEGTVLHDGRALAAADLPALMRQDRERRLNLHVDRAAPFESFVTVLDEARLNGREDLAITALPRSHE